MTLLAAVRVVHLVAAATWVGGLVVMGPLVIALRRAGATRDQLRAAARAFAVVSWTAMAVAIPTGLAQVQMMGFPWVYPPLHVKLAVVGTACLLAAGHQLTARQSSDRVRGLFQLAILLVSLGIVVAAVRL
jgi:putative copper export protein